MRMPIDWLTAALIAGFIIVAGAISYTAWWHFADHRPWLIAGTWQPPEPIWPPIEPLRFNHYIGMPPSITTSEGWQVTPAVNFRLHRAERALRRGD